MALPSSIDLLRKAMRHRRRLMGLGAQQRAAQSLCRHVIASSVYQRSRHIAFYLATEGEIDLRPIIQCAWRHGKTCYLPVIEGECLDFVNYSPYTRLHANRFGISEPESGGLIKVNHLDLVLTPLVAFDDKSNRLGMGGGFYDKTFAFAQKANIKRSQRPFLVGVAHRFQQVQRITPMPWDVPLDQVITD